MPNIIEISDLSAPQLAPYVRLTEAQLKNRLHPEDGLFIAESPKVIGYALDAGYAPVSLLMERKHIAGKAAALLSRVGDAPVYTAASPCWRASWTPPTSARSSAPPRPWAWTGCC